MACLVQNTSAVDSSGASGNWSALYGSGAKLDQNTIQYIHKFYCQDCRMEKQAAERAKAAAQSAGVNNADKTTTTTTPTTTTTNVGQQKKPTSPQRSLDEASLHQTMDKNKESLKRKLMLRRSVNELVDQGIYPPLKTPPAFAEQRKQLERAKTGDLLRHKIQSRPDRKALVQQHILEDTNVDPSLQDRRRQLKRARLLDGLNDKLFHRPGPLELVQGNILQTDDKLSEAVKDGRIRFSRTIDMEDVGDIGDQPIFDGEDSNHSDGAPSPGQGDDSSMSNISSPSSVIPPPPDISLLLANQKKMVTHGQPLPLDLIPPITTQSFLGTGTNSIFASSSVPHPNKSGNGSKSCSSSASRNKKSKPKSQPKPKVIKFHEYKGPPNIVKTQPAVPTPPPLPDPSETPYHVMLQQQQLFLQWQLEFQQKNLPFPAKMGPDGTPIPISQASPGGSGSGGLSSNPLEPPSPQPSTVSSPPPPPLQIQPPTPVHQQPPSPAQPPIIHKSPSPQPVPQPSPVQSKPKQQPTNTNVSAPSKSFSTFEEMKVADLKVELKKRNLPVSGPKPQLIERLRPFADSVLTAVSQNTSDATTVMSAVVAPLKNVSAIVKVESRLKMEPAVKVEHAVIKMEPGIQLEECMHTGSPPISPTRIEPSSIPMSPDVMDIQSPPNMTVGMLKSQFSSSQGSIPMIVDQLSRPPSTAPPEIAPMETDQPLAPVGIIGTSLPDFSQSLPTAMFKKFTAVAQPLTTPLLANQQVQQQQMLINQQQLQQLQQQQQQQQHSPTQQQQHSPTQQQQHSPTQQQQHSPTQLQQHSPTSQQDQRQQQATQDDLLRQQQKKIEELQRQLQQSQLQLKIHQEQQRLLQQQKLLQQQMQQHQQQIAKHQTLQQLQQQKQKQQQQQLPNVNQHFTQLPQQQSQPPKPQVQPLQQVHSPPLIVHSPPMVQQTQRQRTPTPTRAPQSPPQPQPVGTIQISILDSSGKMPQLQRVVAAGAPPIQIPFHLLQASQSLQNSTGPMPAVIVSSSGGSPGKQAKSNSNSSMSVPVKSPPTVVLADLNLGKPQLAFATPPPNGQPFIFTSNTETTTKTGNETMPPNGISRSTSLQGPLQQQHLENQKVKRSPSNPFFSFPLKEPPKYDEAIKSKQHQNQVQNPPFLLLDGPSSMTADLFSASTKSQAIDDVLEILIRNGELPASAAQEPPPTPKTTTVTSTANSTSAVTISMDIMLASASSPQFSQLSPLSNAAKSTVMMLHTPVASPAMSELLECSPGPPPLTISSPHSIENPTHELSLSEQDGLPAHLDLDFSNMDWSSDPVLGLDLADSAGLSIDPSRFINEPSKMLSVPYLSGGSSRKTSSTHGSEPDLAALGLNDPDSNNHMQIDVSDWLDVIMPSTGLTPLSTNAPVSFPSDPILTPKTQQEVLDMFNFDDVDFNTPTDPHSGMSWDKLTDPSVSSS